VTGNRDVAKLLISKGAKVDHKDRDGKTALMVAVVNGHQPLVELLLDHKADIYVQNEVCSVAFVTGKILYFCPFSKWKVPPTHTQFWGSYACSSLEISGWSTFTPVTFSRQRFQVGLFCACRENDHCDIVRSNFFVFHLCLWIIIVKLNEHKFNF
jgi:hypothetical protein